jgi:uncharacterized protein
MNMHWPKTATPQQRAATKELLQRLQAKYAERILKAVLFGSVARGKFTPDSDIDILVLTDQLDPITKWDMWRIAARVSLDFDVILDPHVYSRVLWESLRAQGRALYRNVEREGVALKLKPAPVSSARASQST